MLKNVIRLWQIRSNVYLNFLYTFQLFFILQFNAYILIWCAQRAPETISRLLIIFNFLYSKILFTVLNTVKTLIRCMTSNAL